MTETTEDGQVGHFEKEMIEELERLSQLSEENEKLKSQLSNREKENPEIPSWEYGEFMKTDSVICKAQSSVFDALKLTHSMLAPLLSSQRNGGLSIEDWKALSNVGHEIKRDAQQVAATLEQEALASLNKEGEEE